MEAEMKGPKAPVEIGGAERIAVLDLLKIQMSDLQGKALDADGRARQALATGIEDRQMVKADTSAGRSYEGPILARDAGRVVQLDKATDRIVVHDPKVLQRDTKGLEGKETSVRYPMGGIGLVKEKVPQVERDNRPLEKSRDSQFGERSR